MNWRVLGGRRDNPKFGGLGWGQHEVWRKWGGFGGGGSILGGMMAWGSPNVEGDGEAPVLEGGTNLGTDPWIGVFWGRTDVGGPSLGVKLGGNP